MVNISRSALATVTVPARPRPTEPSAELLSPSPKPSKKAQEYYRPELDSLRFFAFLGVFFFHVTPHDPSAYLGHRFVPPAIVPWICGVAGAGAFGVDLFFALSAYLITGLLLREKSVRGHIDVKSFYLRRILRIWPLYFLFIAIALALTLWDRTQRLPWPYVAGYLLLAGNWVYALKGLPIGSVAIPLWSISIEEQFYLFWPPILRHATRRTLVYGILALLVVANAVRVGLVLGHASGAAVEYNTLARIDAIALGILAGCWLGGRSPRWSSGKRLAILVASMLAWLVVATFGHLNAPDAPAPVLGTLLGRPLVALAAVMMLVAFIGAAGPMKVLCSPVLTYLGKISYGLYVYHLLGVLLAEHLVHAHGSNGHGAAAIGLLLTVALSAISYTWFESPFLRLKNRFAVIRSRPV
jgi:peptidoglycan/LPS O-acetylase OafA/YrhL